MQVRQHVRGLVLVLLATITGGQLSADTSPASTSQVAFSSTLQQALGTRAAQPGFDAAADLNGDGYINILDVGRHLLYGDDALNGAAPPPQASEQAGGGLEHIFVESANSTAVPGQTVTVLLQIENSSTPLLGYSIDVDIVPAVGSLGTITPSAALSNFYDQQNLITQGGAVRHPMFSVILETGGGGVFVNTLTDDLSTVLAAPSINDVFAQIAFDVSSDACGDFVVQLGARSALADGNANAVPFTFTSGTITVPCGRCCADIGGAGASCLDDRNSVQCSGEAGLTAFVPDAVCDFGNDCNFNGVPDECDVDCQPNGVPDDCDISSGTSVDCDLNGVPDECDPDCQPNGVPDVCDISTGTSLDCNANAVPDECDIGQPLDIVFVFDTSGSMGDESAAFCIAIPTVLQDIAALGVTATVTVLGITETPPFGFDCVTDNVVNMLGGTVPGDPSACEFPDTFSAHESWGPATAIVADRFPWSSGAVRVIVPISDEGPCDGSLPDGCNDPGDDRDSITNAINVALGNNVLVFPIAGTSSSTCVTTLAAALGAGTGGRHFETFNAFIDIQGAVAEITMLSLPAGDCTGNGIPDDCDLAAGTALDCNSNTVPDVCDVAVAISDDCNANLVPDECLGGPSSTTYDMRLSDLVGVQSNCGSGPYNWDGVAVPVCGFVPGFTWLDTMDGVVSSVQIDFNVGVDCHNAGTELQTTLNGMTDAPYVTPLRYCLCSATAGTTTTLMASPGNYIVGGWNTFLFSNTTACLGFETQAAWGGDVYARVTVTVTGETDCNTNLVPDDCDISSGSSADCNGNGIPDECDIAAGTSADCNNNLVPDECDISSGTSDDCNVNDIPDECDVAAGTSADCNTNLVPDECDIASVTSTDCNSNTIPDECDIAVGTSTDCNGNGIPDECLDGRITTYDMLLADLLDVPWHCGGSVTRYTCSSALNPGFGWQDATVGIVTDVQIEFNVGVECGTVGDTHTTELNGIAAPNYTTPQVHCLCAIIPGATIALAVDVASYNTGGFNEFHVTALATCLGFIPQPAWGTGIYARVTVTSQWETDCNANGVPDECDISTGTSNDCNLNGLPDECEPDCNLNAIADECDITAGTSTDCNLNGIPDECDITAGTSADCNLNGIPDECLLSGPVVYDVLFADLLNVPWSCGSGAYFNGCIESNHPGFTWMDAGTVAPSDLNISFNIGVECDPPGTTHTTSLNDIPNSSFSSTPTHCTCGYTAGELVSLDADISSYNAGGINTFLITNPNPCLGFTPRVEWGSGVYSRVTVTYGLEPDCNNNGLPDDCDIAAGTSSDCDGNGNPDTCDFAEGAPDCNGNGILDACDGSVGVTNAVNRGWWDSLGTHDSTNNNTLTGRASAKTLASYFTFDVFDLPASAVNIVLRLEIEGYSSSDASETLTVYDVSTDAATLEATGTDVTIFDDLRTGNAYGSFTVTLADDGSVLDIPLNAQAAADLAASGQFFSVGIHLTSDGGVQTSEWVRFSGGSEVRVDQLTWLGSQDCNGNGILDECDIASGTSPDLNGDGVPDECEAPLYVDADAVGPVFDGSSWCQAFTSLQDALAATAAVPGFYTEIRVATGTYRADDGANQTLGDRDASFQLQSALAVRGGYAGCGEADPDARDITGLVTRLSGDLNGDDPVLTDNSYHVVRADLTASSTAVLDGFAISAGNAEGGLDGNGGGLSIQGSPTLSNLRVEGNYAAYQGAGMSTTGSATITHCMFVNNWTSLGGFGAGIAVAGGPKIINCQLTGNTGSMAGSGMFMNNNATPTLVNCTIADNLNDPMFSFGGDGIYFNNSSGLTTIINTILWGNGAGSQFYQIGGSGALDITYSDIQGCTSWCADAGDNNISDDPNFTIDYQLQLPTGAVDGGNNNATLLPAVDLAGISRIIGGTVDMGVYELPGGGSTERSGNTGDGRR